MTHGLDDSGVKYDSNGNLKNWFTEEAKERFDEKANCFVRQYSSEYVPEVDMNVWIRYSGVWDVFRIFSVNTVVMN